MQVSSAAIRCFFCLVVVRGMCRSLCLSYLGQSCSSTRSTIIKHEELESVQSCTTTYAEFRNTSCLYQRLKITMSVFSPAAAVIWINHCQTLCGSGDNLCQSLQLPCLTHTPRQRFKATSPYQKAQISLD
jgi:hypothetical protein